MTADKPSQTAIAIIGAAGFFPKAPGLREYWHLLYHGVDAISEIPDSHWSPRDYYDPDPQKADHVYCKRGGFLEPVPFDPAEFGIPPSALPATDTSQLLGLLAAKRLLETAGYGEARDFDRDRTSVILGVTGTQELVIPLGARLGYPAWRKALEAAGLPPETLQAALDRMADAYVPWQENSFPGLLGNVVAGRICNRLNLGGTNCVVDAACASSMSAVHLAVMELESRRCDMAISGGVDTLNDIFMHMCFARTHTLSRTGDARPFAAAADGTVLGEGVGLLLLKRLADAEADGDTILAVIRGIGSSSDGKSQSIYAPRPEGQAKALRKAYRDAGFEPSTVGLLEAHGTGTRVGDRVEFSALCSVFGEAGPRPSPCALGSVKSNIGHTKAAAGAAGLIKTALALHHKVLPKTLKVDAPDPDLNIGASPFRLNTETRPWISSQAHPRRAGVSAFGFGGSNFHLVLEEYGPQKTVVAWDGSVEIIAFSAPAAETLRSRVRETTAAFQTPPPLTEIARLADASRRSFSRQDAHRLVLTVRRPAAATSAQAATAFASALNHAAKLLAKNGCDHSWRHANVFYGCGAPAAKAAFLFPGQGSQYVGMGRDLACFFPEALAAFETADDVWGASPRLSALVFPCPARNDQERAAQEEALCQTDKAQPAIGAVSQAMLAVLERFGVRPQAACGHSYGELTALHAAGRLSGSDFLALSVARGKAMAAAGGRDGEASRRSNGAMLAVKAPLADISELLKELDPCLVLANRNSPEQGVISGPAEAIARAERACENRGLKTRRLPVAAAFHSTLVQSAQAPFAAALAQVDFSDSAVPVYANSSGRPYPADSATARTLLGTQLVTPVDFVGAIETLYRDGFHTFVEVGPKSVLTGLVKAILQQRPFQAVAMDASAGREFALGDLAKTLSQLAALGIPVDLAAWEQAPPASRKAVMAIPVSGANLKPAPQAAVLRPAQAAAPRAAVTAGPHASPQQSRGPAAPPDRPTPSVPAAQPRPGAAEAVFSSPPDSNNDRAMNTHTNCNRRGFAADAFEVVREGLKSMEALQRQTAETHQKFLETQTEANHCLQRMMDSIQRLTEATLGDPALRHAKSTAGIGQPTVAAPHPAATPAARPPATAVSAAPAETPRATSSAAPATAALETHLAVAAQPVRPAAGPGNDLEPLLLAVVSELTGYPAEMLTLEMDIEADLGIDSIKRVEILSALEERHPELPPVAPETMGSLRTLGQIVAHLAGVPAATATRLEPPTAVAPSSDVTPSPVQRQVVTVLAVPAEDGPTVALPAGSPVVITDNGTPLSAAITAELAAVGVATVHLPAPALLADERVKTAAGLVLLPGPASTAGGGSEDLKMAFRLAQRAEPGLRAAAARQGALLASVTRLDGAFGFKGGAIDDPYQGGLAGLVKTAAIEWAPVTCHALDVDPDWQDWPQVAQAVVRQLLRPARPGAVETGLSAAGRVHLGLRAAAVSEGPLKIAPGEVVVVSGGGRGVTAQSALELARAAQPTLVLLGRSPLPDGQPSWLKGLTDEKAVKKAIIVNELQGQKVSPVVVESAFQKHRAAREISRNLDNLRATGARVHYHAVDVTDAAQVKALMARVREEHGPIRAIVHGAGVLEDRLIGAKTAEQFDRVFDTKVAGLASLLESVATDDLRYLVLFSSVAGRMGNRGQVDYAMANEVLNKLACQTARRHPGCKVTAINWGPWDGGMVTAALKREFQRQGVELIPAREGAACLVREMRGDATEPVEVVIGSALQPLPAAAPAHPSAAAPASSAPLYLTQKHEVDVGTYPVLASHQIDGLPVVPFALMAEWFGDSALHANPGLVFAGLDDIRLLKGIRLENGTKTIRLMAAKPRRKGGAFEVEMEIRNGFKGGQEMIHSRARAILNDSLPTPPAFTDIPLPDERPYPRSIDEIYEQILFHGRSLRGITEILGISAAGIIARIAAAPDPAQWITHPARRQWVADPLILDAAFQLAIVWCHEERQAVCLPSYCARYRQYCRQFPAEGVTAVLQVTAATARKLRGDFTFLDSRNAVLAEMAGYEAIIDADLMRAFKPRKSALCA